MEKKTNPQSTLKYPTANQLSPKENCLKKESYKKKWKLGILWVAQVNKMSQYA